MRAGTYTAASATLGHKEATLRVAAGQKAATAVLDRTLLWCTGFTAMQQPTASPRAAGVSAAARPERCREPPSQLQ
jgi:hypothetical protein